jgi:hypothetical protein
MGPRADKARGPFSLPPIRARLEGEMKTAFAPLALLLALAACHSQPTAGGLTADEERALDNAAAMLDQQNIFDTSDAMDVNGVDDPGVPDNSAAPANHSGNVQ